EDDEDLRHAVAADLAAAGLQVDQAGDLAQAHRALESAEYHCAVFDRMLPDGDAITYVHRRRQQGWAVTVLFLTARDQLADRLAGLEHGGADYPEKPFGVGEMTARVMALRRRGGGARPSVARHANHEHASARREVRRAGVLLSLTSKEFAILEYLMARPDQAVPRAELIEHCWGADADPMSNVVDVVVLRLRRKLREPNLIHTVRGLGYRLV